MLNKLVPAVPLFAALGDATRLGIVLRLTDGRSRSISELSVGTNISRQALTRHLQVLKRAGLLSGTRSGREHHWELESEGLNTARAYLELVSRQWDAALERLRAHVEAPRPKP
ncbi:winged helix-turn-helix transcriptional regulator [bacterium]|nr:winged helix-turn-helix transcriptional regulator [bacterium]